MLKLNGQQFKQLQEALLSAFPDISSLSRLLRFELGVNLDTIATGRLSDVVFHLITWAEAQGRVQQLIDAARRQNPGNPLLRQFLGESSDTESELTLSGEQLEQLQRALRSAFPTFDSLRLFVRTQLDENLAEITGGNRLSDAIFDIIVWAESRGRLKELAEKAYRVKPDDPELHRFAEQFLNLSLTSTHQEAPEIIPFNEGPDVILSQEQLEQSVMRIEQLTVENFRCFESRTFDLTPQFNVLIGDNGAGKTAVLEAFSVALATWLIGLDSEETGQIRREDVRLVGHRTGEEFNFEEHPPVSVSAEGWIGARRLHWRRSLKQLTGRTTMGDATEIRNVASETFEQVRTQQLAVLPVIAYYGTARLWHQPRQSETRRSKTSRTLSRFEGYRNCMGERINAGDLTQWMERQDRIAYQEKREPKLYQVVRRAMQQSIEEVKEIRYNSRRSEIVVEFKNGALQPFRNLSDGQRNMVALAGDLAMRMARLNPQFGLNALEYTPGVVLIDELDLHLHPNWQRRVVENLRSTFPRVQFIATTHSPFIIQTLREDELIMLEGQPVPQLANLGIEDIARGLMDVPNPEVSPRYQEMVDTGKDYLQTLEKAAKSPEEKLEDYKKQLADKIAPYADNPAFQAILELERVATLGE